LFRQEIEEHEESLKGYLPLMNQSLIKKVLLNILSFLFSSTYNYLFTVSSKVKMRKDKPVVFNEFLENNQYFLEQTNFKNKLIFIATFHFSFKNRFQFS